ncbi:MAG: hypothetical protein D6730_13495 [Bacteroidetes bacterium]|nr:MAG: hypothetical protein D6730_13495 [Bacteroidota bacterium]
MNKRRLFPACLLLLAACWLCLPALQAQQPTSIRFKNDRYQQPQQQKVPTSTKSPEVAADAPAGSKFCHFCQGDMQQIEQVKLLMHELKTNALNPQYDWQWALKMLYSSPHVMKTPIMDPTFPIILRSGDAQGDQQAYNEAKEAWIKQYPERYQALKKR